MIMVPSTHKFQVLFDELMLGCFVVKDAALSLVYVLRVRVDSPRFPCHHPKTTTFTISNPQNPSLVESFNHPRTAQ